MLRATTACTFSTSQLPKVLRDRQFLTLLTSKCASRHNGVHFFNISTSKSRPRMTCFDTFYFQMCFAPQRCALFRHRNVQKWSEPLVFLHFDFEMCFAPQRRVLFRHLNFQKWSEPSVLYILTWTCASRHNGVHFFDISTSKRGPSMWCFVHFDLEMCFAPQRRAIFHLSSGQMAPHPPL